MAKLRRNLNLQSLAYASFKIKTDAREVDQRMRRKSSLLEDLFIFPFSNDLTSSVVIWESANRPLISFLLFRNFSTNRLCYYSLLTIILSFPDVPKTNRDSHQTFVEQSARVDVFGFLSSIVIDSCLQLTTPGRSVAISIGYTYLVSVARSSVFGSCLNIYLLMLLVYIAMKSRGCSL